MCPENLRALQTLLLHRSQYAPLSLDEAQLILADGTTDLGNLYG